MQHTELFHAVAIVSYEAVSHAIRAMMIAHKMISKNTAPAKTSDTSPPCPAASLREGELVVTRSNRFTMPNIAPRQSKREPRWMG